jgi:phosphohistidine phosphatase
MKNLLVMRHAKSSWKDHDIPDHDRPLKKRGEKDAEKMGKMLKDKDLTPDLILSSTAARAKQTAKIVHAASKCKHDVVNVKELYMAEPSNILEAIVRHAKKEDTIMVIGHNPGMEAFVQILTGKVETLPTASIAYITAKIENWKKLGEQDEVTLKKLWRPKE